MAEDESPGALYERARRLGAVLDLSGRAQWRLRGADRIRYLNGQVTNDIRRVRADAAMTACVTTAKGRLSGVIFVSAGPDFLRIDAEAELRESLGARLERYIIADDAALEDATGEECLFHVLARERPEAIAGAGIRTATRLGRAGYDLLAPAGERERVLGELGKRYVLAPEAVAESLRIEGGVPRWGAELTEETLPPEAGLDETAIDYHKGCYIGQEVISRIKSVGHVNRRLAGLIAQEPMTPGMTLAKPGEPRESAGVITSAGWSFGLECWAALGYVKRGFAPGASGALDARSPQGAPVPVQVRELPLLAP